MSDIPLDLFQLADKDEKEAERSGYSNYSYWRSTFQIFMKSRLSVFLLIVLPAILLFTFLQPLLPGQRPATQINFDETGFPLRNIQPCAEYWFGTNSIGQDLGARIWSGTRTSLLNGLIVGWVNYCSLDFIDYWHFSPNAFFRPVKARFPVGYTGIPPCWNFSRVVRSRFSVSRSSPR